MGLFGRRSEDVIDLTELQKRGILKRAEESSLNNQNEGEIVDLGSNSSQTNSESSGASALSFLGDFANVGANNTSNFADGASNSTSSAQLSETAFNDMKVKLENTEYKLERALERLAQVEEKLASFERRVS